MSYSPDSAAAWANSNREIKAKLTTGYSGTIYEFYDGEINSIESFSLDKNLVSGNNLTFGSTCSAQLNIKLKKVSFAYLRSLGRGRPAVLQLSVKVNNSTYYTTCGRFYIDSITTTELREMDEDHLYYNDVEMTCFDMFYFTEREYIPTIAISSDNPQTLQDVAIDVAKCAGFYDSTATTKFVSGFSTTLTITSLPDSVSCRDMFGYLAGYEGKNCIITNTGSVATGYGRFTSIFLTNQTSNKTITQNEQYMDEYVVDGRDVEISRVESGTAEDIVVYPSNGEIVNSVSYQNPWITSSSGGLTRVTAIYNNIIGFARQFQGESASALTFTPMTVKWRGYPELEVGEFVLVEDKYGNTQYCCIMQKTMDFDGGYSETYKCLGEAEKSISFSINPAIREIKRIVTNMEEAIQEATEAIGDIEAMQEGVFSLIPSLDGSKNVGWLIEGPKKDSDPTGTTSNYIMANSQGIGFSSNGGSSFNAAAIYIDKYGYGHINGNFIVANTISTSSISFSNPSSGFTSAVDSEVNTGISNGGILIGNAQITAGSDSLSTILNSKASNSDLASATAGVARYAESTSLSDNYTKSARLPDNASWTITKGSAVTVKFSYTGYYPSLNNALKLVLYYKDGSSAIPNSNHNIYYNGSQLYQYSSECWNNNATVSFVFDGTNWVMQDNVAMTLVSDWCMANNRTYIDGSNIYTGTIEASTIYAGVLVKRGSGGSITGYTKFDLNNDKIVTEQGNYLTEVTAGKVDFKYGTTFAGQISSYNVGSYYQLRMTGASSFSIGTGDSPTSHDPYLGGNGNILGITKSTTIGGTLSVYGQSLSVGPASWGNNVAGHITIYPCYGTNWHGTRFSPHHDNGNYSVEIIDDSTSSATGVKLRPSPDSWDFYNGSNGQRWTYGYFVNVISTNGVSQSSDRKQKTEIEDINEDYENFFDSLRPVTYKRKTGDRTHIGFVAQEVEDALKEQNMSSEDFGGLCMNYLTGEDLNEKNFDFDGADDEDIVYSLRYEEFIALCVDKIQKLEKRIKELENKND